jgi:hypothetical protein
MTDFRFHHLAARSLLLGLIACAPFAHAMSTTRPGTAKKPGDQALCPIDVCAPTRPDVQMRQVFRANLGAESGSYTDWEMTGINGFHSVSAKFDIQDFDANASDKWAALARLAVAGVMKDDQRDQFSVMVVVDRKTGKRTLATECRKEKGIALDVELPEQDPFDVEIAQVSPESFRVTIGDAYADIECGFPVVAVRALGSGLSVLFDPITVTSALPRDTR